MNRTLVISVIIMSLVTIALRFIPFMLFGKNRPVPSLVLYLGKVLPYSIMGMLVVYCLKGIDFSGVINWLPAIVSAVLVIVSYVWKKNTLLSIIVGTACYMILIRML